jgi:hypothetical protein
MKMILLRPDWRDVSRRRLLVILVGDDPAIGQLLEQLRDRWRNFTFAWNQNCPSQVLAVLFGTDPPGFEFRRGWPADLNYRPMPNQSQGDIIWRHRAPNDEMVIAVHQNTQHSGRNRLGRKLANNH